MSSDAFCAWHVITVEEVPDDTPEIGVMHPGCPFTVTVHPQGTEHNYACIIQYEIDLVGYDTLLEGHGPGWYRERMRNYTIRGADWSEIETEYEVEPLTVASVGFVVGSTNKENDND